MTKIITDEKQITEIIMSAFEKCINVFSSDKLVIVTGSRDLIYTSANYEFTNTSTENVSDTERHIILSLAEQMIVIHSKVGLSCHYGNFVKSMFEKTVIIHQDELDELFFRLKELVVDIRHTEAIKLCGKFFKKNIVDIVNHIVVLGGKDANVSFSVRESDRILIEKTNSFNFAVNTLNSICRRSFSDFRLMLVDGFVESVSQLDTVFASAVKSKQQLCIIAKGFGDDIVSTVNFNNQMKKFDVMLCVTNDDMKSVNVLNDIAVVCHCDIVNSLKGQLVNSVKFDDLAIVKECFFERNKLSILGKINDVSIMSHLAMLRKKMQDSHVTEEREAIVQRMKSLSNCRIEVRLPSRDKFVRDISSSEIPACLLYFKCLVTHGVIELDRIGDEQLRDCLISSFCGEKYVAFDVIVEYLKRSNSLNKLLTDIGTIVV